MADLTTLDILRWGREVIANPDTFCVGVMALDAKGRVAWSPIRGTFASACRFCSGGVLWAMHDRFGIPKRKFRMAQRMLCKAAGGKNENDWRPMIDTNNKGQSYAVAMWTRAIALAEKENHG